MNPQQPVSCSDSHFNLIGLSRGLADRKLSALAIVSSALDLNVQMLTPGFSGKRIWP